MPEFGSFSVGPDGRFVSASPRPKFKLLAPFGFKDPQGRIWEVPAGVEVDGASIPRVFWTIIGGPFEGNYLHASVVHDHFCRTRTRSAEDTHKTFYLGMRAKGVPEATAKKMFVAVSAFGPKWRLTRAGPQESARAEPLPDVDLDDAATREQANRSFYAIAQSLEASGGDRFATAGGGMAEASIENLQAEAERLRESVAGSGTP
jgi:hypothetical protein